MPGINGIGSYGNYGIYANYGLNTNADLTGSNTNAIGNDDPSDPSVKPGRKSSPAECETCKNRKYQDGSDEMVSFKSAAHISPEASSATVRAHEQEHVTNAYNKAAMNNGKVLSATVSLQTAVCPECGSVYTSGGTTTTKISYSDESNPYVQNQKSADAAGVIGKNVNLTA